ncbi:MAG: hypothetical protein ACPGYV_12440, partial [Phycisphaeraceae bacterium]
AAMSEDASLPDNPQWMSAMSGVPVLALLPRQPDQAVAPGRGVIGSAILDAVALADWWGLIKAKS